MAWIWDELEQKSNSLASSAACPISRWPSSPRERHHKSVCGTDTGSSTRWRHNLLFTLQFALIVCKQMPEECKVWNWHPIGMELSWAASVIVQSSENKCFSWFKGSVCGRGSVLSSTPSWMHTQTHLESIKCHPKCLTWSPALNSVFPFKFPFARIAVVPSHTHTSPTNFKL